MLRFLTLPFSDAATAMYDHSIHSRYRSHDRKNHAICLKTKISTNYTVRENWHKVRMIHGSRAFESE